MFASSAAPAGQVAPDRRLERRRRRSTSAAEPETLVPFTIEPDVLWSCTTCGACVEECPVDIEHIDAIVDMRRYEVLMESRFPTEAGLMLRNIENQGDPWGRGPSKRTEWTQVLDFEVPVVIGTHPRRRRVPLLGRLCRRPRRAGPQGRAGHRPDAAPGRRHLRHLGPQGVVHGRPGPAVRQRVPLPGAGQGEHRHPDGGRGEEDRRHLPALLQHDQERVPGPRRGLRGDPPRRAARPPGADGQARPGHRLHRHGHLPRPLLPGPAQPGLRRAALGARRHPRGRAGRDEALPGAGVLLRGRGGPHVDGGDHRQAGQHGADRRGPRHRAPTWSRPPAPTA